jgi:hypothetical protein
MMIFNRQVQQCTFTIYQREIILFVCRIITGFSKIDVYVYKHITTGAIFVF